MGLCVLAGAWLLVAPVSFAVSPAFAQTSSDWDTTTQLGVGQNEIWVGVDAGPRNWLVYAGTTYAPDGDVHANGWRVRSTTGYGNYTYDFSSVINPVTRAVSVTQIEVDKSYADLMIGYQYRFGELTAKAFVGAAFLKNDFAASSRGFSRSELDYGVKGAVELWLNMGPSGWGSLDVSYADTRATFSARARAGYRVLPAISIGIEGILNRSDLTGQVQGNDDFRLYGNTRGGVFVRAEWFGGEVSASGGLSGDMVEAKSQGGGLDLLHQPTTYGTLNWIVQY
jgi:Cellulose biosynthesis protein BcsS